MRWHALFCVLFVIVSSHGDIAEHNQTHIDYGMGLSLLARKAAVVLQRSKMTLQCSTLARDKFRPCQVPDAEIVWPPFLSDIVYDVLVIS